MCIFSFFQKYNFKDHDKTLPWKLPEADGRGAKGCSPKTTELEFMKANLRNCLDFSPSTLSNIIQVLIPQLGSTGRYRGTYLLRALYPYTIQKQRPQLVYWQVSIEGFLSLHYDMVVKMINLNFHGLTYIVHTVEHRKMSIQNRNFELGKSY